MTGKCSKTIFSFAIIYSVFIRCKTISLGTNQESHAKKQLAEALSHGNWIVFENCHIVPDWMLTLESLFTNFLRMDEVNEEFRWWFILEPTESFPLIILREGNQIINEPLESIKDKMMQKYSMEPLTSDKFFNNAFNPPLSTSWYRYVFALNAFHAVVQERRYFGPIGWSNEYDFNDNLLDLSISQLRTFMKHSLSIPFDDIFYLLSECHYGNEIIDATDRRLLISLLDRFCTERITSENRFFDDGRLCIPVEPNRENSIVYLNSLSAKADPNDVGLHTNASYMPNVEASKCVSIKLLLCFIKLSFKSIFL